MSPEAIKADSIEYSYGSLRAVRGISFQVHEKEIFGFIYNTGRLDRRENKSTGRMNGPSGFSCFLE